MVHADGAQIYRDTEYFVFSMSSASVDSKHLDVIDCKFQILKIPAIQMKDAGLYLNRPRPAWSDHAPAEVAKGIHTPDV